VEYFYANDDDYLDVCLVACELFFYLNCWFYHAYEKEDSFVLFDELVHVTSAVMACRKMACRKTTCLSVFTTYLFPMRS
jgi:hypothetical protein